MGLTVVSLFDGGAVGLQALKDLGIPVQKYYASEIDKFAKIVSSKNHPEIIHLGDIKQWLNWKIPWGEVDLILSGSPCQGFSRSGKQLNFEDPRSKLFFKFADILDHVKGKNSEVKFLLENVPMPKFALEVITERVGVDAVSINSSQLVPQNRLRYYWYNWRSNPISTIPTTLNDILESDVVEGVGKLQQGHTKCQQVIRGSSVLQYTPLTSHKSKVGLRCLGGVVSEGSKMWLENTETVLQRHFSQGNRVYSPKGVSCTLSASGGGLGGNSGLYLVGNLIRQLTVLECTRLQGLPEGYTTGVPESQQKKILGNGWTLPIIKHLFKNLYKHV